MTTATTKRLARAALLATLSLPAATLLPAAEALSITKAYAAPSTARTIAEFKAVLADYGTFGTHAKYGEIWVPTVTPQGWHPYPACQWVYTKNGWYFNDETPWGSIVHHYGRWSHDEKIGWFWVPDENWSPGWVAWRKSDQWIGWAPMPPQQDAQLVSSAEFNNDKFWVFMDAKKFFNGECGGTVQNVQNVQTAPASQVIHLTKYVTIFDLPPGLLVDVVFVPYWSFWVISQLVVIIADPLFCPPVILPWKHTEKPPEKPPGKPPGEARRYATADRHRQAAQARRRHRSAVARQAGDHHRPAAALDARRDHQLAAAREADSDHRAGTSGNSRQPRQAAER